MSTQKIFIYAIISLLVISAITFTGLKLFVFNDKDNTEEVVKESLYYNVDQMICNLKETSRIVRLKVIIETTDEDLITEFDEKSFLIKNDINETIRSKTYEDLEGSDGQLSLQKELTDRLNTVFSTNEIINIYFEELIIQ
ncbi:flagellar basal body-associated FliL family protein [Sporosalibacterium faouarense]|uniref:flagellar basal body-associated FliL family protein n=1 Tax=Sporosalibacterium faouarense TaxID=516123 RepID=UPI00192B4BF6|nr:flagellar basal body-associated FliL family protein [Sporosalibacterium faouarense]